MRLHQIDEELSSREIDPTELSKVLKKGSSVKDAWKYGKDYGQTRSKQGVFFSPKPILKTNGIGDTMTYELDVDQLKTQLNQLGIDDLKLLQTELNNIITGKQNTATKS